ncbi:MAG: FAD:protein FMN transferase [Acidobacteria bacterium]|nr:FAD:protein FMN transferase [Acidobacteriota bacterium]MDW7984682.1 FAD:protein FMN transferase [Acidobacteriota bacterium]
MNPKRQLARRSVAILVLGFWWTRGDALAPSVSEARGWVQRTWVVMGTYLTVRVSHEDPAHAERVLDDVIGLVQDLDRRFTLYDPSSELWALNRHAGGPPVPVSEPLWDVLERAIAYSQETAGAFDVTVGPIVQLWGFLEGPRRIPSDEAIAQARARVGYTQIEMNPSHRTVRLATPGMVLDLGGIAKGYALDRAVERLRQAGFHHGFLNFGGDIYAMGASDGVDQPWTVVVRHPRRPDQTWRELRVRDMAVSTSGDYERFFVARGRRYSHILSPWTGRPVEADVVSVTVVTPSATEADALSTAFFVMGPERARTLVGSDRCRYVLWIRQQGNRLFEDSRSVWPPRSCPGTAVR